jgi:hypothetical protein
MTDQGSGIWSVALDLDMNTTHTYKFRNQPSFSTWDGFEEEAGLQAGGCGVGTYNDRFIDVTDQDLVLPVVAYGSCTVTPIIDPNAGDSGSDNSGTVSDPSKSLLIIDNGLVTSGWGGTDKFSAFDEENGYGDCTDEANDTETCASIDWEVVTTAEKGDVLQVSYAPDAQHAGIVVGPIDGSWNVSSASSLDFDIKVVNSGSASLFKYKLESDGANSGEIAVAIAGSGDWESISIPASEFNATAFDPATANAFVFLPDYQTGDGSGLSD